MASLSEAEFRDMFWGTPVSRTRYSGFLRNVAVAMGNSSDPSLLRPLEKPAKSEDPVVEQHAIWAIARIKARTGVAGG